MSVGDKDMPHLIDFAVHGGNDGDVVVDDTRIADSSGVDFDDRSCCRETWKRDMHGGELLPVAYDVHMLERPAGPSKTGWGVMDDKQGGEYKTMRRGHGAYVPMISAEVIRRRERIMLHVLFVEVWVGSR